MLLEGLWWIDWDLRGGDFLHRGHDGGHGGVRQLLALRHTLLALALLLGSLPLLLKCEEPLTCLLASNTRLRKEGQ